MGVRANLQTPEAKSEAQSTSVDGGSIASPDSSDAAEIAHRGRQAAMGLAILVVESMTRSIADSISRERTEDIEPVEADEEPIRSSFPPILAGAMFGLAIQTVRTGVRLTSEFGRAAAALMSFAPGTPIVRNQLQRARAVAMQLDERWRDERAQDKRVGSELIASFVPRLIDAVLDRIDLTELALSRIDVDRIVGAIDVETIVRRVDLAGIARDVLEQLDLPSIARRIIDEIDLQEIVRESTGTMADETVEGIREQGVSADLAVSRFVDHLLGRDGYRRGET